MEGNIFDPTILGTGIPSHIKGISCNVKNCIYHDGDAYCTAEKISVGPSYASSCTDTVCATFKARNQHI